MYSPLGTTVSPPSKTTVLPPSKHRQTNPSADWCLLYTVDSCELWIYWSETHQIYTKCSLIIDTFNAPISVRMFHGISEWQHDECKCVGRFSLEVPRYANELIRVPTYLWSYQICTRCSHIISVVNAHMYADSDIATRFRAIVQRMQVVSLGVHDILPKSIDCHGNVPWHIGREALLWQRDRATHCHYRKAYNRWMILTYTQGHYSCCY